jgi:DNA-binding CsgD family transcriptional regulator
MEGMEGRLFDVVYEIAAADDLDTLRRAVTNGVSVAVPCDLASYTEVSLDPREVYALFDRPVAAGQAAQDGLARLAHQHPLITRSTLAAETISDYLSAGQFHDLELYTDVYRLLGAEDQIAITVMSSPTVVIGVALNRDRASFTPRDRDQLNALRPQIVRGYRRTLARDRARALLERVGWGELTTDAGLVALTDDGVLALISEQAQRLLSAYFPSHRRGSLPGPVAEWAAAQPGGDPASLTVDGEAGQLELTLLVSPGGQPRLIELREHRPERALLTDRELQILRLVAQGETNHSIADRLALSRRTVENHLRSIYQKLGVSNRTAAAAAWNRRPPAPRS